MRSLFWVVLTEVPNPVDEIHHLGYIDHLATGKGIPVVGEAYLPRDMLALMRQSPTFGSRRHPLDPDRPEEWGPSALQYEGVQPPLYYLTMVPAYLAGRPWGALGSLYAVRIATVLMALATLPLTWLLAERLFPRQPTVRMFSTLFMAMLQGFNANLASATNDALVIPLAVLGFLVMAKAVAIPTWRGGVLSGLVMGLAMLAKLNAVALVGIFGLAVLILPRHEELRSLRWRIGWASAAVALAGVIASTWLLWNLYAYGRLSGGSEAAEQMLSSLQPTYPFNLRGILTHLGQSQTGFWQFQRHSPYGPGDYGKYFVAAGLLAVAASVAAVLRTEKHKGRSLGWLASCWPLAFLTMLAIVYIAYTGTIVGRHTYLALAPLLIFTVAGILVGVGPRAGAALLAAVLALALWREQTELVRYVSPVYLEHVYEPGVTPVYEQPFSYGWKTATGVTVASECPVVAIGLGVLAESPAELSVTTSGGTWTVKLLGEREGISIYTLSRPLPSRFVIHFDSPVELGAAPGRFGWVQFEDERADRIPMAQIQCRRSDWRQLRFAQRFKPLHLDLITLGRVHMWTRGWALAGVVFAVVVLTRQLKHRETGRPKTSQPPSTKQLLRPAGGSGPPDG